MWSTYNEKILEFGQNQEMWYCLYIDMFPHFPKTGQNLKMWKCLYMETFLHFPKKKMGKIKKRCFHIFQKKWPKLECLSFLVFHTVLLTKCRLFKCHQIKCSRALWKTDTGKILKNGQNQEMLKCLYLSDWLYTWHQEDTSSREKVREWAGASQREGKKKLPSPRGNY